MKQTEGKKFIKPLDNVRSDSVHRDRSYWTVVLRFSDEATKLTQTIIIQNNFTLREVFKFIQFLKHFHVFLLIRFLNHQKSYDFWLNNLFKSSNDQYYTHITVLNHFFSLILQIIWNSVIFWCVCVFVYFWI